MKIKNLNVMADISIDYPKIPDSVKLAILIPTARWEDTVKSILAYFVGIASPEVAVLIADNSENIEKHRFLNKLNEINEWIIPFIHKKNIGATGNFFFLHDWSKDIKFTAVMADDDCVSPTYYLDAYKAFENNPSASCISVGAALVDFGDHQLHNISQPSMIGLSPLERIRNWNGLAARITVYDVSRRATLNQAIAYSQATPIQGMTLLEDLFELSRLASGDFLGITGPGFFVHYPFHGARSPDGADRFYRLLCKDVGLKPSMIHFMGLSTAIQCALFLLGDLSPIANKNQRNLCAQHVFSHLFFNGFHREFSQDGAQENIKKHLVNNPAALAGFERYCNVEKSDMLMFDFDIIKWFAEIIKVFESKPKRNEISLSKKFSDFCSSILKEDEIDLNVKDDPVPENSSAQVGGKADWSLSDWFIDRRPSASRVLAIQAILQANPNAGTLGIAIIAADGIDPQTLANTLDSIRAQHRPVDSIWVVGGAAPTEVSADEAIECLSGRVPWPQRLSDRIAQGDAPDFLWVLHAGDQLLPEATLIMGEYRLRQPDPLVWYSDEAVLDVPMLKPDFNLDLLRSYPYLGRSLIVSTAAVQAADGLDASFGDLAPMDLVWRLVERNGPLAIGHISEVLVRSDKALFDWVGDEQIAKQSRITTEAHLARLGVAATLSQGPRPGLWNVRYELPTKPLVSIIIPTRNHFSVLQKCIESLMEKTHYTQYELLIVDNNSTETDACRFLNELEALGSDQIKVLRWPAPFNFSKINNFAARQARGDVLLFLNNDIEVIKPEWLSVMLSNALRPEVGIVGARLDYPDGRVQHAGLVLGMDNSVGFAFRGMPGDSQGYMCRLQVTQNVSAVTGACMMMRRDVFDEIGGFDEESFSIYYGDVDLALRARQAGFLTVWTPEARLVHMGGATRLLPERFGVAALPDDADRDHLYAKWLPQLASDPAYHPAYGKHAPGFDLSPDVARIQKPLPGRPLPVILASHGDWHGCGYYRIIQPFQALEGDLRVEGGLKLGDFHFTDVASMQPDVIVLQGAWANEGILKQIERYQESAGAKVALEFDDYLPNVPVQSIYRKLVPQSVIKKIRRAIEKVDWLVVSTPALAEEYARYHDDIRVANNGLFGPWWKSLVSERKTGKKPRVGWAGGSSHTGDMAIIRSLVKEMENEVEWVFMGMQPKDVVCEFHAGVPIDQYPKKLASLNLDLAVVPLEINQFNICKSNLRLLELGVCGVPIICTDIEPYRCNLPVTRVRNRHQDWAEAIRSHLYDLDATAKAGDQLREAVLRDWMLEGSHLDQWTEAWLPKTQ